MSTKDELGKLERFSKKDKELNYHKQIHVSNSRNMGSFGEWFRHDTWGGALDYYLMQWRHINFSKPEDGNATYWVCYRLKYRWGKKFLPKKEWHLLPNMKLEDVLNYKKNIDENIIDLYWTKTPVPSTLEIELNTIYPTRKVK